MSTWTRPSCRSDTWAARGEPCCEVGEGEKEKANMAQPRQLLVLELYAQ
jgi:hypothetical protein